MLLTALYFTVYAVNFSKLTKYATLTSFVTNWPTFEKDLFCMQLLLQIYADSFDTLQVYRERCDDVHIVCILSSD